MVELKAKRLSVKIICVLVAISFVMGIRFFFAADRSFQRDSDRFVSGMIAAGVLDIDVAKTGFGMNLFCADNIVFDGSGDAATEGSTLYFLYNAQDYSPEDVKIERTREQQVGVQSWIAYFFGAMMDKISISGRNIYHLLRAGNAMLLSFVLVFISYELGKTYNMLFALSFYIVCLFSPWLVNFAPSLYWVAFSWFVPMWLGLRCLNHPSKRFLIYPCIFAAIVFKCLCGYEYISNVMLGAVFFLIVEWLMSFKSNKQQSTLLFKEIVGVSISCILGFVVVLILHSYMRGDGNIIAGFEETYRMDILRRTFGDASNFDAVYADSLHASIFIVLIKYFVGTFTGWFSLLLFVINIELLRKNNKTPFVTRGFILLMFSLLCSVSWLVLAKSHSYIHTHINPSLFYLPYIPIAVYLFIQNSLLMFFSKRSDSQVNALIQKSISSLRKMLSECN